MNTLIYLVFHNWFVYLGAGNNWNLYLMNKSLQYTKEFYTEEILHILSPITENLYNVSTNYSHLKGNYCIDDPELSRRFESRSKDISIKLKLTEKYVIDGLGLYSPDGSPMDNVIKCHNKIFNSKPKVDDFNIGLTNVNNIITGQVDFTIKSSLDNTIVSPEQIFDNQYFTEYYSVDIDYEDTQTK